MTGAERSRFLAARPAEWTDEQREDVAEVVTTTSRDDTGVSYGVEIALRSLAASAFEMGEDRLCVWTRRVDLGSSDAHCAGGGAFVAAAHEQERVAAEIASRVWGAAS